MPSFNNVTLFKVSQSDRAYFAIDIINTLKEIHEFCDTTYLLYKYSMYIYIYPWKLA